MRGPHIARFLLPLAVASVAGGMLFSNTSDAEADPQTGILPPAKSAAHVHIINGSALESVRDNIAIIQWTSNNPGGSDEHFGVVHYGTDPEHLSEMAKSHIRLNQGHPETVFRVRVDGLKPQTTYYYTVDSQQSNGKSDGVKSTVKHFTNPLSSYRDVKRLALRLLWQIWGGEKRTEALSDRSMGRRRRGSSDRKKDLSERRDLAGAAVVANSVGRGQEKAAVCLAPTIPHHRICVLETIGLLHSLPPFSAIKQNAPSRDVSASETVYRHLSRFRLTLRVVFQPSQTAIDQTSLSNPARSQDVELRHRWHFECTKAIGEPNQPSQSHSARLAYCVGE
jgi:Purple acid Phosphatase, N-terminal domain